MSEPSKKFEIKEFLKFRKLQNKSYPVPDHNFFKIFNYGDKGTSKTTLALAAPGDVLINSYEDIDNIMLPIKNFYGEDPRFQVKGYDQFLSKEPGMWRESSDMIYNLTIKSLKMLEANNIKFDWVITDGYQELAKIAEMKMRYKNNISPFAGVKPRTIWNERKQYLDEYYRLVKAVAKRGVIFTSQNVINETDDDKKKEPAWQGKIKNDVTTTIFTSMAERIAGDKTINTFYGNIQNCKISLLSKKTNITLKFDKDGNLIVDPKTGRPEFSPVYLMKELLTTRNMTDLNSQW